MNALLFIFGALGGLGGLGGLAALAYIGVTRKKINAEARLIGVNADDVLSGRALEMYDRAMTAAQNAEAKAQACQERVSALREHVDRLEGQMRAAGLTPPAFHWPPMKRVGGAS